MEKQLSFLREIDKLKNIIRKSPLIDQSRKENSAEHSWHLAMYALVLSEFSNKTINIDRVIRMLLIHDIVEIDAGDHPIHDTTNTENQEELESAVKQLNDQIKADCELVTLSEHGVFYQSKDEKGKHAAHLRSIADVSGAGDTVISIAGLALTLGLPLAFVAELSNLGGGIVCESPGVVPINKDRLIKEAESNSILKKYL